MSSTIIRIAPYEYIHVLDNNHNTTRVVVGPLTFTVQDHEKVVLPPTKMVIVPPRFYAVIRDPAIREPAQKIGEIPQPVRDRYGQVKLRHGDLEIRFHDDWPEPFPLMPGEALVNQKVSEMSLVLPDTALRLVAKRDFVDKDDKTIRAGDEWLFIGPGTYRPRIEVEVVDTVHSQIIQHGEALKLRARKEFKDGKIHRNTGEEWLVRAPGAYLPKVDEIVVSTVKAVTLTPTKALHLLATQSFDDVYNVTRKAGEEWLVIYDMAEMHIPDVYEEVINQSVLMTVLNQQQYCVILDPVDKNGKNAYGTRLLRRGPASFFLLPGENLEGGGIHEIPVLAEQEALLLRATDSFVDPTTKIMRTPGDLWMVRGPCEYVPTVKEEIVEARKVIPLDYNEGIYIRNIKTGQISSIIGPCTYMLKSHEELWEKHLSKDVEDLLTWSYFAGTDICKEENVQARDKTRVVSYRVPHNSAVQIYDYAKKSSRVVFGPTLVLLGPDDQLTVLNLSGSKPKRPNVIKCLALLLGPDFMTDIIEVETSDHARLRLQLSYNWMFDLTRISADPAGANKLFQVRDFVGDACKALASRIRGACASKSFDDFHRNSARMIRKAVFGFDPVADKVGDNFLFRENNLLITNIDIQSVEPVDQRTRESLQKSVQQAIEITTKKQEASARHDAAALEQKAKGLIERQKIQNATGAEEQLRRLMELKAECNSLESTGVKKAEAKAAAQALEIEGKAEVQQAKLLSEAAEIESKAELDDLTRQQDAEIQFQQEIVQLDVEKAQKLADIESGKFAAIVGAIGPETIKEMAKAGPEMQARLLKGLGMEGYIVTDGNSPINLFKQANGMIGVSQ